MSKSLNKVFFAVFACLFFVCIPFVFSACSGNNAELEKKIDDLQTQITEMQKTLDSSVSLVKLTKETEKTVVVKKDMEFLVIIPDDASFLYLSANKDVTLTIDVFSDGAFVDYTSDSVVISSSSEEFTIGTGMYKITVVSVKDANSASLTALLTSTQQTA